MAFPGIVLGYSFHAPMFHRFSYRKQEKNHTSLSFDGLPETYQSSGVDPARVDLIRTALNIDPRMTMERKNERKLYCRDFPNGYCRFGKTCRFVHEIESKIVDLPPWMFTTSPVEGTVNISRDEMRAMAYKFGRRNELNVYMNIWDEIWKHNYVILYCRYDELCECGDLVSKTERNVDLRDPANFVHLVQFHRFSLLQEIIDELMRRNKDVTPLFEYVSMLECGSSEPLAFFDAVSDIVNSKSEIKHLVPEEDYEDDELVEATPARDASILAGKGSPINHEHPIAKSENFGTEKRKEDCFSSAPLSSQLAPKQPEDRKSSVGEIFSRIRNQYLK